MEIAERIFELLNKRKMTGNQLQKACDLSNNAVSAWRIGRQKPSLEALIRISEFFEVSLDYLVGREDLKLFSRETQNVEKLEKLAPLTELIDAMDSAELDEFVKSATILAKGLKK